MQNAAYGERSSRLIAGCAGVAATVVGVAALPTSSPGVPPVGVFSDPAAALVPAGLALLLQVLPVPHRVAGRVVHGLALLLALAATVIGVAAVDRHRTAAIAVLVASAVLVLTGHLVRTLDGAVDGRRRLAGELRDHEAYAATLLRSMDEATTGLAERQRAEAELTTRADDLVETNAELRASLVRLEAALAFKNDLTSMLTHDVAQPISSIASLAELLRADWADLPDDIKLELATKIDKNTQRLIKMMNDLQLLFRLDMGSVTTRRAPVPLRETAETVAGSDASIEVDVDEELSALVDRGHLIAALEHLVSNAVAYGGQPILIGAARNGGTVDLFVRDSGPGIAEDLLPNLFGRFVRGAGLGLFIVRHLVEANGGSVRYEAAEPHGARLVMTLEAAPV